MADNTQIADQVREAIANAFDLDESEIANDISQANCGRWSSLNHMILMAGLEEQFRITLSMNEMTKMTSLADIVGIIQHHMAAKRV